MDRTNTTITLSEEHRKLLEGWVAAHGTPQQVALRCRIILRQADGWSDLRTAAELGVNRHTCRLWRLRMLADGPSGLWEVAAGRGRKPQPGLAARIIETTLATKPKGQTHWSSREMAKQLGVHHSTVARVWSGSEIKPHRHKHPRFHIHFIPTSSSWLNLVERWFAELTNKAVRRGSFQSVPDLIGKIMEFVNSHNENAKSFAWTATAEDILAKIAKCRKRLEEISPGCTSRKQRKVA